MIREEFSWIRGEIIRRCLDLCYARTIRCVIRLSGCWVRIHVSGEEAHALRFHVLSALAVHIVHPSESPLQNHAYREIDT